jgi:Type VI secretion system, TssN
MNKLFSQEILRMLGIVGLAGLSLMTFLGVYISKARGSFAPYRKATIIYLLLATAIGALAGIAGTWQAELRPFGTLLICQVVFFTLGFLHIRCMHRYLKWSGTEKSFWFEFLFTVVVAAFCFMAFIIVFSMCSAETGFRYYIASSVLFLIIAFFVYTTFLKAVNIPEKIYSKWFYPIHEEVADPDEAKLKNILVISFEFQKKKTDPHFTNFRAKAPADMEFGQLFYYFINDYNERHPNGKIEFMNERSDAYGWMFYRKPRWYSLRTKYMDTEKTFFINHVKENDIIVCKRV